MKTRSLIYYLRTHLPNIVNEVSIISYIKLWLSTLVKKDFFDAKISPEGTALPMRAGVAWSTFGRLAAGAVPAVGLCVFCGWGGGVEGLLDVRGVWVLLASVL